MLRSLILPVIAPVFALFGSAGATSDNVRVEGGMISVSFVGEVRVYKGHPFAARPVGELRWKAPQPVAALEDVRKRGDFGPDCTQAPYSQSSLYYSAQHEQSEDDIAAAFLGGLRDSSFTLPMRTWARMTATGRPKANPYFFSHFPSDPNSKRPDYPVNFATTGDPDGRRLPKCAPYNFETEDYLDFGDAVRFRNHLLKAQLDFIEQFQKRR